MYSIKVPTLYRQFRAAGQSAEHAIRSARIVSQFRQPGIEWDSETNPDRDFRFSPGCELGRVRIIAEPDDDYDWSDFDDDFPDYDGDREAFQTVAQVWNGSEWEDVDSVCGHVGYRDVLDPVENFYVVDLMASALDRRAEMLADIDRECLAWSAE